MRDQSSTYSTRDRGMETANPPPPPFTFRLPLPRAAEGRYTESMALLKIARMGHPVLARRARPIEDPLAESIQRLIGDMAETVADADGIGLAAPQVHRPLRLILFIDAGAREEVAGRCPIALINPEIEILDATLETDLEGCLSIPGLRGVVPRYRRIGYRGLGADGRLIEREADGVRARVVQHEVDHLDGILYPMRMPDLRYLSFESELRHLAAGLQQQESSTP
jgi:peptide deformylase